MDPNYLVFWKDNPGQFDACLGLIWYHDCPFVLAIQSRYEFRPRNEVQRSYKDKNEFLARQFRMSLNRNPGGIREINIRKKIVKCKGNLHCLNTLYQTLPILFSLRKSSRFRIIFIFTFFHKNSLNWCHKPGKRYWIFYAKIENKKASVECWFLVSKPIVKNGTLSLGVLETLGSAKSRHLR